MLIDADARSTAEKRKHANMVITFGAITGVCRRSTRVYLDVMVSKGWGRMFNKRAFQGGRDTKKDTLHATTASLLTRRDSNGWPPLEIELHVQQYAFRRKKTGKTK